MAALRRALLRVISPYRLLSIPLSPQNAGCLSATKLSCLVRKEPQSSLGVRASRFARASRLTGFQPAFLPTVGADRASCVGSSMPPRRIRVLDCPYRQTLRTFGRRLSLYLPSTNVSAYISIHLPL